jgi:predicted DNA-binding transcriptional regulator AlpA
MTATSDIFQHRANRTNPHTNSPRERELATHHVPGQVVTFHLDDEQEIGEFAQLLLERLAKRLGLSQEQIVERLQGSAVREQPEALVDAREIARRTGRSRWWVYEHAGELGAVRLGSGSRPRLAFWPSRVDEYVQAAAQLRQPIPAPARARPQRRRRDRRTSTGVELLPIRGHDA